MILSLSSCGAQNGGGGQQARLRYDDLSDFDIVGRSQRGDNSAAEYLLYKYRYIVRARVSSYFLVGAEREDLLQVGMIGLWQAVMDYRYDRSASFSSFANLCVTRHLLTAVKSATRCKQSPLNCARSLETDTMYGGECGGIPLWRSAGSAICTTNPEALMLKREDTHHLHDQLMRLLSAFEWSVLCGYQTGKSYQEIAAELECNAKSVDNALVRIKRKMASYALANFDAPAAA